MFDSIKTWILTALIAVAFVGGWKVNGWRLESSYNESLAEVVKEAKKREGEINAKYQKAANEFKAREKKLAADASNARDAAERLRNTLSSVKGDLSSYSESPCRNRAIALADVFGDCTKEYRALAKKADGITSDRQQLIDSWPGEK